MTLVVARSRSISGLRRVLAHTHRMIDCRSSIASARGLQRASWRRARRSHYNPVAPRSVRGRGGAERGAARERGGTMAGHEWRAIDGDGHIVEVEDEINDCLEAPFGGRRGMFPLFPSLDGRVRRKHGMAPTSAAIWRGLLDAMGLAATVVYPTQGLSLGLIQDPEWAVIVARGYNTWLAETYIRADPRIKGVALLPPQDVPAAARDLDRCIRDRGMVGGLLPSVTYDHVPFGDARFGPLYAAA